MAPTAKDETTGQDSHGNETSRCAGPDMTLSEALAAASVIVGDEVHLSATEYRQRGGMMTLEFCLQLGDGCELIQVDRHLGDELATWPEALDLLRDQHAELVAKMRALPSKAPVAPPPATVEESL